MTTVREPTIEAVAQTLADVWEARNAPHVETAINGWPTVTGVAKNCEYHRDNVKAALIELAEQGEVRVADSLREVGTVAVPTYNPKTVPTPDKGVDWSDTSND